MAKRCNRYVAGIPPLQSAFAVQGDKQLIYLLHDCDVTVWTRIAWSKYVVTRWTWNQIKLLASRGCNVASVIALNFIKRRKAAMYAFVRASKTLPRWTATIGWEPILLSWNGLVLNHAVSTMPQDAFRATKSAFEYRSKFPSWACRAINNLPLIIIATLHRPGAYRLFIEARASCDQKKQ
ncbi:hypothetical protein [Noviherbaspirillum saxi]|uniref:hypothetical protein n=1 Tax=Noviherbaspirillum saxi TaxID=2320863 RepID=UPI001314D953|nr:hypothetical protein [Noviherbaspirillum saxi]